MCCCLSLFTANELLSEAARHRAPHSASRLVGLESGSQQRGLSYQVPKRRGAEALVQRAGEEGVAPVRWPVRTAEGTKAERALGPRLTDARTLRGPSPSWKRLPWAGFSGSCRLAAAGKGGSAGDAPPGRAMLTWGDARLAHLIDRSVLKVWRGGWERGDP